MRKLLCSLALFVAVGLMVTTTTAPAPAQPKDKKDDKKDVKKEEKLGTVEVYQAKDGWRFKVLNAEGKTIAMATTGHDKKDECLAVLDLVKATLAKVKVTEVVKDGKDGKK
jgi:uncharacterized protein YegP (UPF0339 family)